MRIFVCGTRGIPGIPGGVERHCEELYPRIVARGHEVILSTRSAYVAKPIPEWRGVKLVNCFSPKKKSLEAIVHTFISLVKAKRLAPDVIHIHAVGPSLLVPFAKLLGFRVVVTNHGPDYDRGKWGVVAKTVLKAGEWLGGIFADEIIVISRVIETIVKKRTNRRSNIIYNGVNIPVKSENIDFLQRIGAEPGKYFLSVARFVPEKGLHDLVQAFGAIQSGLKLVIAGDADHEDGYSRNLKRMAAENPNIILTGYIGGDELRQVYSNAALFVLPSYHEGLPIALLEAMSYGLPALVSDIPANKEVDLPEDFFFRCGDVDDLMTKLDILSHIRFSQGEKALLMHRLEEKYNWDKIALQTISVYEKAIGLPASCDYGFEAK